MIVMMRLSIPTYRLATWYFKRVFFTLKAEEEEDEDGLWYTIIINHQQP